MELDLEADATGPLVEPEPASAATTSGPAVEANLTGLRVLVVEDNPDNQRIVEYLLGERGAEVSLAADGEEGVATVLAAQRRGEPFDAVLMDVQMPVKDGLEAARELRAAGIPTPIIALTAYAMADDEQRCLEAGCDRYIRKPIAPAELVAAVAESLPPARRASLPSRPSAAVGREGASIVSSLAEEPGFSPLLEEYIGEFPQRRTEITEAIEAGDVEKLRLIVHRLKGTAANYGFPQISRQAATCEAAMTGGVVNQQARRQASLLLDLLTRAAPTGDASRNER